MRTFTAVCFAICSIGLISHATIYTATAQHLESYVVSGAGDPTYNGNYFPNGTTSAGNLRWSNGGHFLVFDTNTCFDTLFVLSTDPEISCHPGGYYIFHFSEPPPSTGWTVGVEAPPPAPTVEVLTLPIEVADFSATANGSDAILSWRAPSGDPNIRFQIEQRAGDEFSNVGSVAANAEAGEVRSYKYTVSNLEAGTHVFRLRTIDASGAFSYSSEVEVSIAPPAAFALSPPYPNPFTSSATLEFDMPKDGEVELAVYDMLGRSVRVLRNGYVPAGTQSATFDAQQLPTGIYIARLKTANGIFVRQLVLSR